MTEQQENNDEKGKIWLIPEKGISTLFPDYENDEDLVKEGKITWTKFSRPEGSKPVTDEEESEKNEAIRDQIKLGIIKLVPKGQPIDPNDHHPKIFVDVKKSEQKSVEIPKPKVEVKKELTPNDTCGCGSGKKYKKCCMHKKFLKGETK